MPSSQSNGMSNRWYNEPSGKDKTGVTDYCRQSRISSLFCFAEAKGFAYTARVRHYVTMAPVLLLKVLENYMYPSGKCLTLQGNYFSQVHVNTNLKLTDFVTGSQNSQINVRLLSVIVSSFSVITSCTFTLPIFGSVNFIIGLSWSRLRRVIVKYSSACTHARFTLAELNEEKRRENFIFSSQNGGDEILSQKTTQLHVF